MNADKAKAVIAMLAGFPIGKTDCASSAFIGVHRRIQSLSVAIGSRRIQRLSIRSDQ